jgi:hypothetical protein
MTAEDLDTIREELQSNNSKIVELSDDLLIDIGILSDPNKRFAPPTRDPTHRIVQDETVVEMYDISDIDGYEQIVIGARSENSRRVRYAIGLSTDN